jgi:hypothetical protein
MKVGSCPTEMTEDTRLDALAQLETGAPSTCVPLRSDALQTSTNVAADAAQARPAPSTAAVAGILKRRRYEVFVCIGFMWLLA